MKIEKFFDKKENKDKFRARFQLGGKEYRPQADTRKKLNEIIDEIRARSHRVKFDLPVLIYVPTLEKLFDIHKPKIPKKHQRNIFERVSRVLLSLIPEGIKVNELKKAHFQKYIDLRRSQIGEITGRPILDETIDKELYSISSALSSAPLYFAELEDYQKPVLPKAAKGAKRKRRKVVSREGELDLLLNELRLPKNRKTNRIYRKASKASGGRSGVSF